MNNKLKISLRHINKNLFYVPGIICILIASMQIVSFRLNTKSRREHIESKYKDQLVDVAESINTLFEGIETQTATAFDQPNSNLDSIKNSLRLLMYNNPQIAEIGIYFDKYGEEHLKKRLVSVGFRKEDHLLIETIPDRIYDYKLDTINAPWFKSTMDKGSQWLEPILEKSTNKLAIKYAKQLTISNQKVAVVLVELASNRIHNLVNSIGGHETDFGYLRSKKGCYIEHPNQELIGKSDLLAAIAFEKRIAKQNHIFKDSLTLSNNWKLFTMINSSSNFSDDPENYLKNRRRVLINISLLLILGTLLLSGPLLNIHKLQLNRLWLFSLVICLGSLMAVILVIYLNIYNSALIDKRAQRITNKDSLARFKREFIVKSLGNDSPLPTYIPTGLFVNSTYFINAFDVQINGYVWQKYLVGLHDSIPRGFIMPESNTLEVDSFYSIQKGEYNLVGWKFKATLHQKFDYRHYPFTKENIWIKLLHKDFYNNVVLTPDLHSYDITIPKYKAGIYDELVIPGWRIESSNFSIKDSKIYYGLREFSNVDVPELLFNIHIVNEVLSPLVTHFIPILVSMILLYAIMLLTSKGKLQNSLGFNTLSVIGTCAGFFLVVVFSHIDLRDKLSTRGIVYLEYYYFVVYGFILVVATNSLFYTLSKFKLFHYLENKVIQMLSLPVSFIALLIITLWKFY